MPGKSSASQEPEKQESRDNATPLPDPSPAIDMDDSKAWQKEDTTLGSMPNRSHSETGNDPNGAPRQMTTREERTWAVISHLSVLLNLVTGFLGGITAIVIYFVFRDRSRFVAYHAMQSFIFQAITWLGGGLISGLLISFGGAFSFLILPLLCLIPGFLILLLIPISLIYGIIGAVQVNNGEDFRYWRIGNWVRNINSPNQK